ncbi:hypothetical protein TNCV_1410831 [Trichonephila clavipes]|nr:hypothetical protein TNCV_1410831 [Trichonephila clavipes]
MNKSPQSNFSPYLLLIIPKFQPMVEGLKPLNWSSEAITAFQRCKQALADAALLGTHPSPSPACSLHVMPLIMP